MLAVDPGLKRYPVLKQDLLQAWDRADELILSHLNSELSRLLEERILILNDKWGALSCALEAYSPAVYTDSYVSAKAISNNSNGRVKASHTFQDLEGKYDLVLVRIPSNLAYFDDLLCALSHHLSSRSRVVFGGMVKYLTPSIFQLIEKRIGNTTTSLAQKKARLIFASFEKESSVSPYPIEILADGFKLPILNHANVFSREKLDIGTRFFLEHLPMGDFKTILDLGSGNGLIGIRAQQLNLSAKLIFSDDSYQAIQSARANYERFFPEAKAEFLWTNAFEQQAEGILDLVLCNPPFHQGTTVGNHIALQMFKDARYSLRAGGRLRVIGNSHLNYRQDLKKLFGNVERIAQNAKFTIDESIKESR
jgi:16S rRNA G1207 methylase RsmC